MVSSFFTGIQAWPASFAHILFMVALFLWQWDRAVPYESIGVHYDRVMVDGQWWRLIIATYSHGSLLHIAFNMYSLWDVASMEGILGTVTYLRYTFVMVIGAALLMLLGTWIMFRFFRREGQRNTYTVGYSGIVFGWMAISSVLRPGNTSIFGFTFPSWLMVFILLIAISLFIPNASFLGHLSGIAIGFAIALGLFNWFDNFTFLCALFWVLVGLLVSLKLTSDFPLPCIRVIDPNELPEEGRAMTIVRGEIMYSASALDAGEEAV